MRTLSLTLSYCLMVFSAHFAYAAEIVAVDVYQAKVSPTNQVLSLTGSIEAKQHADLAPLQSGVIAELFVEVGDQVEQGQKLLSLDDKLAQLGLKQAMAQRAAVLAQKHEAERLYKEVIELSKRQLVAETLLGERLSGLEIAKAELGRVDAELAQQEEILARHTLFAPFAGVIAQRHIDVGEWVTQQSPVLTLVEQAGMRLNINIPQEYFKQFANNKDIDVIVTPDVSEAISFDAKLDRLVSVASHSSRTLTGLVNLPDELNLVAGMSARADIQLPMSSQAFVWLPKAAIKQHPDGGTSVFVAEQKRAKRVIVDVVNTEGNQVAVLGADAKHAFIISGVELLKDGDAIRVNQVQGDTL